MEKDYFKDRGSWGTQLPEIRTGEYVLICEKQNQQSARELSDLTYGRVIRVLTKKNHPRGIKVEIIKKDRTFAIGRVVYLIRAGAICRD